jgi:PucR family transcriptional regulator, purine catabolism regulatory protein
MALTLKFALQHLDILAQARVVAGEGGLDRPIRWAHIVDLPDVSPWVREGDLLLTTAFALKDNPEAQAALIPILAGKGLCGMIVALGTYFYNIPQEMISLANELDFPILTLPWEIPFVEVTQAIHEYILRQQFEHIGKSLHIHEVLSRLVLEGKSLDDIVESLANLLNRSVTIEDPSLRVLAHASLGPIDELRRRSIHEGRTPAEFVAYLEEQGIFERLKEDPRPQRIPSIPELGMTMERTIAPIVVGSNLYGYVWIIATEGPLTELDFLAIEQAATVAALAFTRQQAVFEAEQRIKSGLLDDLLDLDTHQDIHTLRQTLQKLGLQRGYQVLVLGEFSQNPMGALTLASLVERELALLDLQATIVQRLNRLIVLLATPDSRKGLAISNRILQSAMQQGDPLVVGLSRGSNDETQIRQCYVEAAEAFRVGRLLSGNLPGVWPFEKLGFLHWIHQIPRETLTSSHYYQLICEIAEHDRLQGDEYLKTLEAYLDCNGNKQQVSQKLFIHRNTLRQRLQKLNNTWEIDFEDAYSLANLYIALKLRRLKLEE